MTDAYNAAVDLLDRRIDEGDGERIAIIDDRGTTTYAQLADRGRNPTAAGHDPAGIHLAE